MNHIKSFFNSLGRFLGITQPSDVTNLLYGKIVAQARNILFYEAYGVPDTVAGRFDLITLHAYVVMRRLKEFGEVGAETSQNLFDVMFTDMDRNMREMGVGDLGVGRKVKKLAISFYGRVKAYDEGIEQGDDTLIAALRRNIYGDVEPNRYCLMAVQEYLYREIERSRDWTLENISTGAINFGPIKER